VTDPLPSWDLCVDECLGQARRVLSYASDSLTAGRASEEDVAAACALAEAWSDLAARWMDRQTTELSIRAAEEDDEDTEEPVEVAD
jgi:hypothetical protein